jgi:nicotinate-nucleotide pyrophosphorylase (carboxylating)
MFTLPACDQLVAAALAEDLGVPADRLLRPGDRSLLARDVTSASVVPAEARFAGRIVARQQCVVCGLPVAERVFEMLAAAVGLGEEVEVFPLVAEGATVTAGTPVAEVSGPARVVLAAERTALDLVMLLSGIATEAARWQAEAGEGMAVTDTRKTLPGLRALSKYAVAVGGAHNHRSGLWDMVLVKDNHIAHAGGIGAAVKAARSACPDLLVEVEADTIAQAFEASAAGADIVLLDNMDDQATTEAVRAVHAASPAERQCLTEASGGITFDRLASLRTTGVDRVSSSALTLAPPVDFGLDEVT